MRTIYWRTMDSSLGTVLLGATTRGVCCLSFGEGEAALRARFPQAELVPAGTEHDALFARVLAAVEEPGTGDDIPLDVHGTQFQRRAWEALRAIPAGETRSYGEQAVALGDPNASRAVGGANRANPVAVLIPCHRIVAADGGMGGYAYGAEIKAELLRREGALVL